MKISMVTPVYPPHQGGVEVITESIVCELRKRVHQVTVYSPANMEIERNRLPVIKHFINFFRAVQFIKTIPDSSDIIHIQQLEPSLLYSFLLKRKYPKKPIIITCHALMITDSGEDYLKFHPTPKGMLRYFLMVIPAKYLEKISLQNADHVITIADIVEAACSRLVDKSKITTIPNGISLDEFPVRKTVDIINNPYCILCPGRLAPGKGQMQLVEALPKILAAVDATVVFTGNDAAGYKSKLVVRARELGILDRLKFLDGVDFRKLIDLQSGCDIVVIPSLEESFGMSILENMAMGNIIVSTNIGGIPYLIADRITGFLFEPSNMDQLASAVIEGLTNAHLREQIHNNAIEAAKCYSIQKTVDRIEEVYLTTLALNGLMEKTEICCREENGAIR